MSGPIKFSDVQPRYATGAEPNIREQVPRFDPYTGQPLVDGPEPILPDEQRIPEAFRAPEPQDIPEPARPANPYAPVGWKRRQRVEFDITTPTGQFCRVMRLEREDLFRLNLMKYLDTFTPMLMENSISDEERERRMKLKIKEEPDALTDMFMAMDEVVMAATVRPRVTNDDTMLDYGTPKDWDNPRFTATVHINDIVMEDRMAIFASAFGRSMDDLKSVFQEAPGVGSVADEPGIQQAAQ